MIAIGSKVRVNDKCKLEHLRGDTGFVLDRVRNSGYLHFVTTYEGWKVNAYHPEEELDVLEGPVPA